MSQVLKPNTNWAMPKILSYIGKYNAKSKKKGWYIPFSIRGIKNIKSFNGLSLKQQKIIIREYEGEQLFDDDNTGEFREYCISIKYAFLRISPNELPESSWEHLKQDEAKLLGKKKLLQEFNKIILLEKRIAKQGYNKDYPISLEYLDDQRRVVISMGNHRLQAVRNLIIKKKLSPNFKIPVLLIVNDTKLKWRIRNKYKRERLKKLKAEKG